MSRAAGAAVVAAAIVGCMTVAYDLWGPTYTVAQCGIGGRCTTHTASLVQAGLTARAEFFLAVVTLLMLGLGLGGTLVAFGRRAQGVAVIAVAFLALVLATVLSALSVGVTFIPADLLALIALVLGALALRSTPAAHPAP